MTVRYTVHDEPAIRFKSNVVLMWCVSGNAPSARVALHSRGQQKKWLQGKKIEVCSLFNDQQEASLDSNAGFRSYFIKFCKLCSVIKADED